MRAPRSGAPRCDRPAACGTVLAFAKDVAATFERRESELLGEEVDGVVWNADEEGG
jgi:hypothetical protein